MAALQGEERLMIVFADVHYFFRPPGPRPSAHRFEKSSYLYLYGNTTGSGARLEIANNAGTPEQDAFTGSLESCTVRQSHKHPTLATISVNAYHPLPRAASPQPNHNDHHWKLPYPEPTNPRGHLQHLHVVDIYFWTVSDAENFVNNVQRLLQHDQVELLDFPARPEPRNSVVSPVVQQLENIAVRDSPGPLGQPLAGTTGGIQQRKEDSPAPAPTFQPLAYNPAAPAAPEPIKHREKTPPPVDVEAGTGLASTVYRDQQQQPSLQSSMTQQGYTIGAPGFGSVPQTGSRIPSAVGATNRMPSAVGDRTGSVTSLPPPPATSPPGIQGAIASPSPVPSAVAPPKQQAQGYNPNGQAMHSPATQVLGSSYVSAQHPPSHHAQPHYPDYLGSTGHSAPADYQPQQQQQQQEVPTRDDYSIHNQLYRPTDAEAAHDPRYQSIVDATESTPPVGKVEKQTNKVDKGVNRFLKKIEKRIG